MNLSACMKKNVVAINITFANYAVETGSKTG